MIVGTESYFLLGVMVYLPQITVLLHTTSDHRPNVCCGWSQMLNIIWTSEQLTIMTLIIMVEAEEVGWLIQWRIIFINVKFLNNLNVRFKLLSFFATILFNEAVVVDHIIWPFTTASCIHFNLLQYRSLKIHVKKP